MDNPFRSGQFIVYPSHGVGQVVGVERYTVNGREASMLIISFAKDRMTLRIPMEKVLSSNIRPLSSGNEIGRALAFLKKPAKIKKISWSKKVHEYEEKLHSGDVMAIAEIIRALYHGVCMDGASYSETQMYYMAMERFITEYALVENINEDVAHKNVEALLSVA